MRSYTEAKAFLDVSKTVSAPTTQRPIFDAVASRIQVAIDQKEDVLLVGDYDVDGVSSVAILKRAIESLGGCVRVVIPHRMKEGYGLSMALLETILHREPDLLITLDCGISNVNEVSVLKQQASSDVIIFDHHQLPTVLPNADWIVNPKLEDTSHPHYHLCAAGLIYVFLAYASDILSLDLCLEPYRDLACVATIADVVPLLGDNRHIVAKAFKRLRETKVSGLRALIESCGFNKPELSCRDIAFGLAPRLNASGRLYDAYKSLDLLLSDCDKTSTKLAIDLNAINQKRRSLGDQMLKEALNSLDDAAIKAPIIILSKLGWHPGLVGVLASRLVETYGKPVFVIADDGCIGRGSVRSIPGIDVYALLKQVEEYCERFGGHKQAAGFSVLSSKISAFSNALLNVASSVNLSLLDSKEIVFDAVLESKDLHLECLYEICALEPFGEQNPRPLFYCDQLMVVEARLVGANKSHLKLRLQDKAGKRFIEAIGFNKAHFFELCQQKRPLAFLFYLSENTFLGMTSLQLELYDMR